ncbi:hypothetical protein NDU88_001736 [Pleurodeles waltl]|uniref:Uncharacterized protein n=1 Tax=Pleurodeles waltl TaxID=8319 RepID=A0AAV7UWX7_PLEWA|nr:hypothetical protein NDU88_001736 [Pleurodeles waltl]
MPGDLGCGARGRPEGGPGPGIDGRAARCPPLPPIGIALLPAETEEKAKYPPGPGLGPGPDGTPAAGKPGTGQRSGIRQECSLRPRMVTGAVCRPGSVETAPDGGTQREQDCTALQKTLKGEPLLGTEMRG